MRLIDADALKDEFCAHCATLKRYKRTVEECRNYIDPDGNRCFKMRYIDSSPTADAVTVVRCKDCKHCVKYKCKNDACYSFTICRRRDGYAEDVEEDDFCSYGERREETP